LECFSLSNRRKADNGCAMGFDWRAPERWQVVAHLFLFLFGMTTSWLDATLG